MTKLVWASRAADLLAFMLLTALAAVFLALKEPCLATEYTLEAAMYAP